jgi:putative NADPH-quinone reductase
LAELTTELIRRRVSLIVTTGGPASAFAAKMAKRKRYAHPEFFRV